MIVLPLSSSFILIYVNGLLALPVFLLNNEMNFIIYVIFLRVSTIAVCLKYKNK